MRFRLVEEINDKHTYSQKELLEKTGEQLVREFVIGLSTDEIVKKGGGFTSFSVKKGASFILPDGNLYFSDNGKGEELHENILANILVTIIGNETGVWLDWVTHLDEDGEDLMYNYLIDKLGWIKANTGSASVENRCYFVIPHRDSTRPTNLQYYTLEELLEYAKKVDKKKVTVYEGMNGAEDFDYYLFADTPEGIVRSIRGFYARGYFLHESLDKNGVEIGTAGYILDDGKIVELSYDKSNGSYHGQEDDEFHGKDLPEFSSTHLEDDTCIRVYKEPTKEQYDTIEKIADLYLDNAGYCKVEIWNNSRPGFYKIYSTYENACADDTADEVVGNWTGYDLVKAIKKNIKKEELNEVYPNKGESKKDFIARFMKVTKDEYPDVKQRYAVAQSYWSRRNKKK